MRKNLLILCIFLTGCGAHGPKFSSVEMPLGDSAAVYLFREARFVGGGYCPAIQIDGEDRGCLKNGGYIRYEVPPGDHILRVRKRFLEIGSEPEVDFTCRAGDVVYIEWTTWITDMMIIGGVGAVSAQEALYLHTEKSAMPKLIKTQAQ